MMRTKKLLALVMALVMSLSVMAMTASAYSAEEHAHDEACCDAVARKPYARCPICGGKAELHEETDPNTGIKTTRVVCLGGCNGFN